MTRSKKAAKPPEERDNRTPEERLAHDTIRKRVESEGSTFDRMSRAAKGEVVDRALGRKMERVKLSSPAAALRQIREIADGRRHYRDAEGGEGCFDALGEIRDICDKASASAAPAAPDQGGSTVLAALADAADTYMTSDPQMSSHAEAERELERAIEAARTLLKKEG